MPKRRRHKGKPVQISQELTAVMRKTARGQRGVHPEIWARWGEIVGGDLGKRAFPRRLKGRLLVVAVSSSAWLQELSYIKDILVEKISQEVGPDIVTDIQFTLDTSLPARLRTGDVPTSLRDKNPPRAAEIDTAVSAVGDDDWFSGVNLWAATTCPGDLT